MRSSTTGMDHVQGEQVNTGDGEGDVRILDDLLL